MTLFPPAGLARTDYFATPPSLRPALLIYGPTASGKSALALSLAQAFDGAIVNADSMQVYDGLRVLSNQPSRADLAACPHFLFGHLPFAAPYSVGRWCAEALDTIAKVRAQGLWPVLAGGTGLYFLALTRGLADAPATKPAERAALEDELARAGEAVLHAELEAVDPASAAKIAPRDHARLLRALAVWRTTGQALSAFWSATKPILAPADWRGLCLCPPREPLYSRIQIRFEAMMAAGALREALAAREAGLAPHHLAHKAHGLRALLALADKAITEAEAAAIGTRDTRRYAKRQFTFAAHQFASWPRLEEITDTEMLTEIFAGM